MVPMVVLTMGRLPLRRALCVLPRRRGIERRDSRTCISWNISRTRACRKEIRSSLIPLERVRPLAHPEQLELPVQGRALHADEARGLRDVAREAPDLDAQVLALEAFARLAQRHAHQRGDSSSVIARAADDLGRQHVGLYPL